MIPLLLAGLAAAGVLGAFLARRWPGTALLDCALALAAVAGVALLVPVGPPLPFGETFIRDSEALRAIVLVAATASAGLLVIGALQAPESHPALVAGSVVAGVAVTASIADPAVALTLVASLGFVGMSGMPGWAGAFRQVAVVPAFVLPVVLVSGAAPNAAFPMAVLLGMALVARLGSLPLHAFPLRLARGTSLTVVALAVSLLPAAFALLVGAWLETAPLRYVLPTEWLGPVLVTLAALTIAVAAPAMLVQHDLGALLAVHAIADLAIVLVAFGTGTGIFATIAVWLVLTALVRMAMAGVLLAIAARCRSRSLRDTTGWVRAAPLLLPGLVVAMLAGIGWPGSLIWEARREILDTALLQPFATVLVAASLLTAFGYLRLVIIGLRQAPGSLRTPASRGTRLGRWTAAVIAFALACVPFALAFGGTRLAAALAAWQPFAAP